MQDSGSANADSGVDAGIPLIDAGHDAGSPDAGHDSGIADAGTDSGFDAGTDSGTADAGTDAGLDSGVDSGTDAGSPEVDAGTDSGTPDAAVDAGTDAGPVLVPRVAIWGYHIPMFHRRLDATGNPYPTWTTWDPMAGNPAYKVADAMTWDNHGAMAADDNIVDRAVGATPWVLLNAGNPAAGFGLVDNDSNTDEIGVTGQELIGGCTLTTAEFDAAAASGLVYRAECWQPQINGWPMLGDFAAGSTTRVVEAPLVMWWSVVWVAP